ncbi:hypothetical protein [Moorena producens]|nr:hypothetical protein [Moorena producens]
MPDTELYSKIVDWLDREMGRNGRWGDGEMGRNGRWGNWGKRKLYV